MSVWLSYYKHDLYRVDRKPPTPPLAPVWHDEISLGDVRQRIAKKKVSGGWYRLRSEDVIELMLESVS